MYIKITEMNAWENERWSYVFDMSKQRASAINHLMIFIRCANIHFDEMKENTPTPKKIHFFDRPIKTFAASRYNFEFYDSIDINKDGNITLINESSRLSFGNRGSYKSGGIYLDTVLSAKKTLSAMLKMRDKKENLLYKNFEGAFMKGKSVPA